MLGTLTAAAVLAWSGMTIPQVIALSAVPGLAVLALLALLPNPTTQQQIDRARAASATLLAWSNLSPVLRRYLQVLSVFCFAKASEAFIILRGHELGLSTVTLLLLWAWLAVVQTVTALAGGLIADRVPKLSLTLFNWVSLAIGYFFLAMTTTPNSLWIAVTVYGLLSGISEGVERALVSEFAHEGEKGTAFGWYYLITGLAAIPAGLLFGLVWKLAGGGAAFALAAFIALASAGLLKFFTPSVPRDIAS